MTQPEISVVLATRNRGARLAALLDGLRAQLLAADRFEVVVVDDGSTDGTPQLLADALRRGDLDLQVIRHETSRGPSAARNAGWRAARAPVIAFTDDDCVPTPGWTEAGLRAMRANPGGIVQGRVEINPHERDRVNPFAHTLEVQEMGASFETANMFYPRDLLERLGGFDEAAYSGPPGGEDTDLAWRAMEAGAKPEFAQDAVVHHGVLQVGALGRLRVAARWSDAIRVYRRHPELRKHLIAGVFWRYNHWLFFRFLLALAIRRRSGPVALMLAAPYVNFLLGRRTGPLLAPYLIALDAVEVAAVARGAVRHRTFVL